MGYAAITDPSNPFATEGLSLEVRSLLAYVEHLRSKGMDVVVTSTTDHAVRSLSGYLSRHRVRGTSGLGLAIDCRLRTRGNDIHREVFDAFVPMERQLYELIYAGAPFNIKAGRRVPPYAVSSHRDHVHVSVNTGTMVHVTPQEVAVRFPNHRFIRIPDDDRRFYSYDPATGAVFAWNGAPGPVLSAEGQRKLREAGGLRDLAFVPGVGLSAVVGNPDDKGGWTVWNFRDLADEDRD